MSIYGERMARVEVEVQELKRELQDHKEQAARNFAEVQTKLNELLALRNKGAGVLWLLGGMLSTGIISLLVEISHWIKG